MGVLVRGPREGSLILFSDLIPPLRLYAHHYQITEPLYNSEWLRTYVRTYVRVSVSESFFLCHSPSVSPTYLPLTPRPLARTCVSHLDPPAKQVGQVAIPSPVPDGGGRMTGNERYITFGTATAGKTPEMFRVSSGSEPLVLPRV